MAGIKKVEGFTKKQILFATEPKMATSIIVGPTGITAGGDGRKIIKAGTPISGDITDRSKAFTKATTTSDTSNAVGVLLHDVDVTEGNGNGTLLLFGYVNIGKLEADVAALIDEPVKTVLKHSITFMK